MFAAYACAEAVSRLDSVVREEAPNVCVRGGAGQDKYGRCGGNRAVLQRDPIQHKDGTGAGALGTGAGQ